MHTDTTFLSLFLCGDVMTGRGIDQILAHPCPPRLYEPAIKDAGTYVAMAERANEPIPAPVRPAYVWGEALTVLARARPDVRLINLETAVTRSGYRCLRTGQQSRAGLGPPRPGRDA